MIIIRASIAALRTRGCSLELPYSIYVYFSDPNAAKIRLDKPNVVTQEGNIATLAVYVSGYPQPDVYWRKGRRDIDVRKGKYKTLSDGSLQVNI